MHFLGLQNFFEFFFELLCICRFKLQKNFSFRIKVVLLYLQFQKGKDYGISIRCAFEYTKIRYAIFQGVGNKNGLGGRNKRKSLAEIYRIPSKKCKIVWWRNFIRSVCCKVRKMKIIIDTNLWVSFVIGKKLSVMRTLFTNPEIRIYIFSHLQKQFMPIIS